MAPKVIKIKRHSISAPPPTEARRPPQSTRTASPATTARRPGAAGYREQKPAKRKPQGGPPVALFVVIGFVVILLIGLGVASNSSRRAAPRPVQKQAYQRQSPKSSRRPVGEMRDYMLSHEEPELLKARKARVRGKRPKR